MQNDSSSLLNEKESVEMMREGLAIQIYNQLRDYSSRKEEVSCMKLQLIEKINDLQNELKMVEKNEKIIDHEISTRRKLLSKLAKESLNQERGEKDEVS